MKNKPAVTGGRPNKWYNAKQTQIRQ